jgi:hypothetical protein
VDYFISVITKLASGWDGTFQYVNFTLAGYGQNPKSLHPAVTIPFITFFIQTHRREVEQQFTLETLAQRGRSVHNSMLQRRSIDNYKFVLPDLQLTPS